MTIFEYFFRIPALWGKKLLGAKETAVEGYSPYARKGLLPAQIEKRVLLLGEAGADLGPGMEFELLEDLAEVGRDGVLGED